MYVTEKENKTKRETLKILTVKYDTKDGFIDIDSGLNDFCLSYGNGYNGHGLQCVFSGEDTRHKVILDLLDEVSDKIKKIYQISEEGRKIFDK
ncbi:MAG: hypothetical protein K0R54_215 [Clostridiaceae bacterium]|nr:hypothetical protein [Clostridiaceae bacterium]